MYDPGEETKGYILLMFLLDISTCHPLPCTELHQKSENGKRKYRASE